MVHTHMADRQHRQTVPATPKLLGLPPELRNQIYILVLRVDDDEDGTQNEEGSGEGDNHDGPLGTIQVDADTRQPGLLRTCRTIREEAKAIWYQVNDFWFDLDERDASLLIKFEKHLKASDYPHSVVTPYPSGKHWGNLARWTTAVWLGD